MTTFTIVQRAWNYCNTPGDDGELDSVSTLRNFKIVQIKEKREINRFSEADNLEKAIDESVVQAETLRQSILKKAVKVIWTTMNYPY